MVIEQDESVPYRYLNNKNIAPFYEFGREMKSLIRGAYFKKGMSRNLSWILPDDMSLAEASLRGFKSRYNIPSLKSRLLNELKKTDKSCPGTYHPGQHINNLSITTDHFVSFETDAFIQAFTYIADRIEYLFHKALNEGLTQEERTEYDFYILTLNVRMVIMGPRRAFHRNIIIFKEFYKDHPYEDLTSYLRFDFWHDDYYQPWRSNKFANNKAFAQKYFNYIPEAKKTMREFVMHVLYYKCVYTWSDARFLEFTDEDADFARQISQEAGIQFLSPEEMPRIPDTFYLKKTTDELEEDPIYAKKLSSLAGPQHKGGIFISSPEGRLYAKESFPYIMMKYYKGGLV